MKGLYLRSVYFLNTISGGSVTHTSGVVNAMADQIDLEVVSNEKLYGVHQPIRVIPAILRWIPGLNEILYSWWLIFLLKRDIDADFIYQRYSGESFCGARLARIHKIPFVLEFNSSEVWKIKNWSHGKGKFKYLIRRYLQLPITERIEKYNLQTASLIVVVSKSLKENLMAEGVPGEKILVNPNGVDLDRFNGVDAAAMREKYQFEDKFVFGFIGTFGEWHGVLELGKAIVDFYNRFPEHRDKTRFLIIGEGKLYKAFREIIAQSPCPDYVVCTGKTRQHDSPALLMACDAFLSPHIQNPDGTKFFGSPTKLFEYMACGKPIIASDLDQIGDILTHNQTALLCPPGDIKTLSDTMNYLLENPSEGEKLGTEARNLVATEYQWEHHVRRILGSIKKLNR